MPSQSLIASALCLAGIAGLASGLVTLSQHSPMDVGLLLETLQAAGQAARPWCQSFFCLVGGAIFLTLGLVVALTNRKTEAA